MADTTIKEQSEAGVNRRKTQYYGRYYNKGAIRSRRK